MLKTQAKNYPKSPPLECDEDYPERCFWYDLYARVFEGELYSHLGYAFHQETMSSEPTSNSPNPNLHKFVKNTPLTARVPLASRRPAVEFNLSRLIVNDSTSLLFDEGHFPLIKTKDESVQDFIENVFCNTKFKEVMLKAAIIGSLGSCAVWVRILKNKLYLKPLKTEYLTPTYDPEAPDELTAITEKRKISPKEVRKLGYSFAKDDDGMYWYCREWDDKEEIYYIPWLVYDEKQAIAEGREFAISRDEEKTTAHDLGFVPFVWIKNLPTLDEDDVDGECTFSPIISNQMEIDYLYSQLGRGLRYSAEPLLLITTDTAVGGSIDKAAGNALCLDAQSDAKMLEIKGDFAEVVIKYCDALRKLSLEIVGANRADPEKIRQAQSGKAIELMNQSLVWLVSKLRISYGEGLKQLLTMIINATNTYTIEIKADEYRNVKIPDDLALTWPPFFLPTSTEKQADATALNILKTGGLISTETAVNNLAANYDVLEPDEEIKRIDAETKERDAKELKQNQLLNNSKGQNNP